MAVQKAPDGKEYEYNPNDPADVMRVALLCEPTDHVKRERAKAAFEAAAPEAAKQAAASVALGAGGPSMGDIQAMIAAAVKEALRPAAPAAPSAPTAPVFGSGNAPSDPGPLAPVPGATTPVEGSGGNA